MLEIEVHEAVLGITVLKFSGRITMGPESAEAEVLVRKLLSENRKKLVFDLTGVGYIDSTGLGTLVAAHCSAKTQGASLRLCHLGSKFQELLQITKLVTVFDVYDTEAAAVASFSN